MERLELLVRGSGEEGDKVPLGGKENLEWKDGERHPTSPSGEWGTVPKRLAWPKVRLEFGPSSALLEIYANAE